MQRIITLLALYFIAPVSWAFEQLDVQALMPGMVVLSVDGQQLILKHGQQKQGIKLIRSDTQQAILEIDGVQKPFTMGSSISMSFSQRDTVTEQVMRDQQGMFRAHGSINGQSVRFLVDTGASSIAISAREARKLGIPYRLDGQPIRAHTASGISNGWAVQLKTVTLGKLVEHNVKGVVVDGDYPRHVLLGMTFLNRMKVEKEGNRMTISKKQ